MLKAPGVVVSQAELLVRFGILALLSIGLLYLDYPDGRYRQKANDLTSLISYPLTTVAALPVSAVQWIAGVFTSEEEYEARYRKLHEEHLKLQARLQRLEALEADNKQLRKMLDAAEEVAEQAKVARLLAVSQEPNTRKILVNKGRKDGVEFGLPVVDTHGVVGQVTEANLTNSRVTLITDPSHALPVQVNRNGLRTIVKGGGASNELKVPFLTSSADIRKGDVLVTSGLGSRFPPGYPVAKVTKVVADPNAAFMTITAKPMARLDQGREVMIIWPGRKNDSQTAEAKP